MPYRVRVTPARGNSLDTVRRDNLAAVLGLVHRSGGLSRSALTASTGLNRSTIAALVAELVDRGIVIETDAAPTNRVGRPSSWVSPSEHPVAIAVNPEVDAITVGLVGLGARVTTTVRHEVDHAVTPDEAARIVGSLVRDLPLRGHRVVGVGIAVPGLVRAADGLVRWAPHLHWTDAPLRDLVAGATGFVTEVANDASVGALAEHLFGAGRDVSDLVYLNGGASGIGGGVIVGGRALAGVGGYAGEFGQNRPGLGASADRLSPNGTLEDEVSRARLLEVVGLAGADEPHLRAHLLSSTDAATLAELARQRRVLAAALSNAINVFNPELVLLGGFLATLLASAPEELAAAVQAHCIPASFAGARIAAAGLGDDLLMIGAAELAFARLLADPAVADL